MRRKDEHKIDAFSSTHTVYGIASRLNTKSERLE